MKVTKQFFVAGGTLKPDAPCYVERSSDRELYESLLAGEVCYALTARQMGKSSLMVRTVRRLRAEGMHVAVLDLTSIGQNLAAEQWYDGLVTRLGEQLDLEDELHAFWRSHPEWGPMQRWTAAIERIILRQREGRIIIFIDEIDTVLSLPFSTDEFFAGIRECYNRRAQDPAFERLSFVLFGVGAPSDLIRDTRLTPFNIGRRIEIDHFTLAESMSLAKGLPCDNNAAQQLVRRVLYWTAGQPYLTQRLCRAVADALVRTSNAEDRAESPPPLPVTRTVDGLCRSLFLTRKAQERDDNLIFVRERILRSEEDLAALLTTYAGIRRGNHPPDTDRDSRVTTLKLSGLLRSDGGFLQVSNRIYAQVFDAAWIAFNMPEAEVRRQRKAFQRGILVSAGAVLVLLALVALTILNGLRLHPLQLTTDLGDGSVLTLDAVDYNNVHRYEPGRWRTAWFHQAFGRGDGPTSRKPSFVGTSPNRTLAFWLTRHSSDTGAYLNFDWWSHFELVDSEGFCYTGSDRMMVTDQSARGVYEQHRMLPIASSDAEFIAGSGSIANWPRRDPSFELRLFDDESKLVASFLVPNPVEAAFPVWRAEPLPAVRRTGDLVVNLEGLGGWRTWTEVAGRTVSVPLLQPQWELQWKGQLAEAWIPYAVGVSDPTGNSVSIVPARPSSGLSPREKVLRLSAMFYRRPDAQFDQDEMLELGSLEVPGRAQVLPGQQWGEVAGLDIELVAIAGPGRYRVSDDKVVRGEPLSSAEVSVLGDSWVLVRTAQYLLASGATIHAGSPFLVVRVSHKGDEPFPRVHLRATTSDGGSLFSSSSERFSELHFLVLEDTSGSALQDACILMDRLKSFEFLIEPPSLEETSQSYEELTSTLGGKPAIEPREPGVEPQLIDLSNFYSASLQTDWHRQTSGNDLSCLPTGIQEFGGVRFDVRGVVQVAGTEVPATRFPRQVQGIPVNQKCRRLHFLHASGWGENEGTQIGQYLLHYEDGHTVLVPLVYGQNISDWWFDPNNPTELSEAEDVWQGVNQASLSLGQAVRLYMYTWKNPKPELRISRLDLMSTMAGSAPFIIAITAE